MQNGTMTRKGFLAASATAIGGLALLGCSGGPKQGVRESGEENPPASALDAGNPKNASSSEAATATGPENAPAAGNAETAGTEAGGRVLVACFSATGNTRAVAQIAAEHLSAGYVEIEPAEPYTDEDLNYNDETTRATAEQNDPSTRPALAESPDFSAYETILLGHPIWWGKAPRLICTLLEAANLSGKVVAEFCTSGSSGVEGATGELQSLASGSTWIGARRFAAGVAEAEVAEWVDSLGIQ